MTIAVRDSLLIDAARCGRLDDVKILLKNEHSQAGTDLAFFKAAVNGHVDVMSMLHQAGADIHAEHENVLVNAVLENKIDVVSHLIKWGANLHSNGGEYALPIAIEKKRTAIADMLVSSGSDLTNIFLHPVLSRKVALQAVEQYASVASRGLEAVFMLAPTSVFILGAMYRGVDGLKIQEDLEMMEAMGLSPMQKAEMWRSLHSSQCTESDFDYS